MKPALRCRATRGRRFASTWERELTAAMNPARQTPIGAVRCEWRLPWSAPAEQKVDCPDRIRPTRHGQPGQGIRSTVVESLTAR